MAALLLVAEILAITNSAIAVVVAFFHWRDLRMRFFFGIAICVFMMTISYLLIITSSSVEVVMLSVKLTYSTFPVVAQFVLLFSFDYVDRKTPRWLQVVLTSASFIWLVLIWAYPYNHLLFEGIAYVEAALPIALIAKGPLYNYFLLYELVVFAVGCFTVMRSYYTLRKRPYFRQTFAIIIALPIISEIVFFNYDLPLGWFPTPFAASFSVLTLCFYLMRYLTPEWESLGRYAAVEKMSDAFILVDQDCLLIDMNEQAVAFFPSLEEARIGTSIKDIKGFPVAVLDGEVTSLDYSIPPYGDTRHYSISHSPIRSGKRQIGQCVLVFDNTESVRAIDLQQQRELTSNMTVLLDSAPYIGIIFSDTYSIIDCNPAALRFFRFRSKHEFIEGFMLILQKSIRSRFSEETRKMPLSRWLKTALDTGRAEFELELSLRGEEVRFNVSFKAIRYAHSRVVVAYLIPVTESEQRNRLMLDSAPFECDVSNAGQRILDCNLLAVSARGFVSKEDYMENHWKSVPRYQPDGSDSRVILDEKTRQALLGEAITFDFVFCSALDSEDLQPRRMTFIGSRLRDEDVVIRYAHSIPLK